MAVQVGGRRDPYSGETKNQLRDGYGVYNYENKFFRYEGEWKDGKKHGHGKLIMADGSYYEGEFQNGEIEGHGFRYYSSSGNEYSGQFHMGELHGQGVMKYGNGGMYEGEWVRNRRQGYGVMRKTDNSVYQGYLHDNMKHGEGTLIYSNGDRYDGDFIQDMRQGHGELRASDGTLYDGQWRNDLFNGQGTMQHCSGVVYEGLWVNGRPAKMPYKLMIKASSPLEVLQGQPFSINVECQTEEGDLVEVDVGREIQIIAGYKNVIPKADGSKSRETTSSGLFEVIEDVEEKPIPTPYGYDIISYPLTDQYGVDELQREASMMSLPGGLTISKTDLSETAIHENQVLDTSEALPPDEQEEEKGEKKEEKGDEKGDNGSSHNPTDERAESPSANSNTNVASSDQMGPAVAGGGQDESSIPAPVNNLRTEGGMASFQNLILPAPPPMYRPFGSVTENEDDKSTKKSKSRSGRSSKADSTDEPSRPNTRAKKLLGDERFARAGEYVIMVTDVTTPPFFGHNLEPAFIQVKLILPKKQKKTQKPKDKGPKWDTAKHITSAMSRGMTNVAQQELAETLHASQSSLSSFS